MYLKTGARLPQTPSCYAITGWRRAESGRPVASPIQHRHADGNLGLLSRKPLPTYFARTYRLALKDSAIELVDLLLGVGAKERLLLGHE